MAELQGELFVVEFIHYSCANGVTLRGGKLLKQVQRRIAGRQQLLHPQKILIVKRDRRDPQARSCFGLDSPASGALTQLVACYAKQPRQRWGFTRPIATTGQQRSRECLPREVSRNLLRAHATRKEREDLGDVPPIGSSECHAITGRRRSQQLVISSGMLA